MDNLFKIIHDAFGIAPHFQEKLIKTLLIIVVLSLIRNIILRIIRRRTDNIKTRYTWKKTLSYITFFLMFVLIGRVWIEGFQAIGTFLGLLSAGLAIALKDLLANIAAWIFIIVRRPFTLGDRIQIDDHAGDVIDIRAFMFTMLEIGNWVDADQSTGRIIHVPNGKVFISELINYTKGFQFLWNEISVIVTFESDWQKAKDLLTKIAHLNTGDTTKEAREKIKEANNKFMIYYQKLTPIVYTKIVENGVRLTVRYLCSPRKRRGTEQTFWEAILKEFEKHNDIDFAYPTQRFYTSSLNS